MRTTLALAVLLGLLAPAAVGSADTQAPPGATASFAGSDQSGRELLARAFEGPRHAIAGTVAVVVLDDEGPFVSELDVTATLAGEMVVGRNRSFAVGRDGEDDFLLRDGTLLRLGDLLGSDDEAPAAAAVEGVLRGYDARSVARVELETGSADGVALHDAHGVVRERLYVDRLSGVVVRRETFDRDGRARRLVAFTELTLVAATVQDEPTANTADEVVERGPVSELSRAALLTLGKTGWHVLPELPGGFTLVRGFALDNGAGASSLHLLYSDGLYATSLYQQPGYMAPEAVAGGIPVTLEGMRVWRWPGAQPERVLWSAHDMTFTAVGDATVDHLLASLVELPRARPDGVGDRVARGVRRVVSWINPLATLWTAAP